MLKNLLSSGSSVKRMPTFGTHKRGILHNIMKPQRVPLSVIVGLITIIVGLVVIAGWIFDVPLLTTTIPGAVSMKFNTALTFVFLGLSLGSLRLRSAGWITYSFSALTMLSGFFSVTEYAFGSLWKIDELFFTDNTADIFTSSPGRMAFISAICFICLGLGLLLIKIERRKAATPIIVAGFFLSIFSALLYSVGLGISIELFGLIPITSVAISAAFLFIIISSTLIQEIADTNNLPILKSHSVAANLFRRASISLILITILANTLLDVGFHFNLYSVAAGNAIQDIITFFIISAVLWSVSVSAYKAEEKLKAKELGEKKKLEEEAEKNKRLFQTLYQSSEEAIVSLDPITLKFIDANTAALKMFKFINLKELLSAELLALAPYKQPDSTLSIEKLSEVIKNVMATGSISFQFQIQRLNGEQFPASVHINKTTLGSRIILLVTIRDVTAQKLAEKNLREANQKIIELAKAKNEFISLAAHQLRSPITTILNFTEILEDDAGQLGATQAESFDYIKKSVKNLNELVNFLLKISRAEMGTLKLSLDPVNIKELTEQAIEVLKAEISTKKQLVEVTLKPDTLPTIHLDREAFKQVLVNLLSNASRYSPDGSKINVIAELKDRTIILTVQDHGMGIPKGVQTKIFQRFFRADNAKQTVSEGTGLGLALAKSFVEAWGGKIWFNSEENVGSSFFITIPINQALIQ